MIRFTIKFFIFFLFFLAFPKGSFGTDDFVIGDPKQKNGSGFNSQFFQKSGTIFSGYIKPNQFLPWQENFVSFIFFPFRVSISKTVTNDRLLYKAQVGRYWQVNRASDNGPNIYIDTDLFLRSQKITSRDFDNRSLGADGGAGIIILWKACFLRVKKVGFGNLSYREESRGRGSIVVRLDFAVVFKKINVYLWRKIYKENISSQGELFSGLKIFYNLNNFFSVHSGYQFLEKREYLGIQISYHEFKLALESVLDLKKDFGFQVVLSYRFLSGPGAKARSGFNSNTSFGSFDSRPDRSKQEDFRARCSRKSFKSKKRDLAQKKRFKKKYKKYKKLIKRKKRITLNALVKSGISPGRAIKVFRLWSRGHSLKEISRIIGSSRQERLILKGFKG